MDVAAHGLEWPSCRACLAKFNRCSWKGGDDMDLLHAADVSGPDIVVPPCPDDICVGYGGSCTNKTTGCTCNLGVNCHPNSCNGINL